MPARLSAAVPSPQFTVIPVTVEELETENATLTTDPVLAGLGVGGETVTPGGEAGF